MSYVSSGLMCHICSRTYLALAVDTDVRFVRVALGSIYHLAHSLGVEIVALCHANERTRLLLL